MAGIKDCIGKKVKISKNSITIKNEEGKTAGVVRNIISVYDMQPNKQVYYWHILKRLGLNDKISPANCIVKDNELYVFRDMKRKAFHEKYGYFNDYEIKKGKEEENNFRILEDAGINIIECFFV